jgi:ATP-dependent DNA helicase RecG
VFEIPTRPVGTPLAFDGTYLMRSGEKLVPMTPDVLKRIFAEDQQDWFCQPARADASPDDVIALLDTQTYFELLKIPYPTNRDAVLERLQSQHLISQTTQGWTISNLAAILLAKKLDAFSPALARKASRVIIYDGINKLQTRTDNTGNRGYAVSFDGLVDFVHTAAPQNLFIEEVVREEVKMFPKQALRELIANALIHQDFLATGASVTIEMYTDRVEISNPGIPPIQVERFIDEYRSRNEQLADLMRRFGICEEKGSGIDKVVSAAEVFQLPAPDFRVGEIRTTAVLFAHQSFANMSKADRIRACYQHCCLLYVSNQRMSNQTLRDRFRLSESGAATVSLVIKATKEAGLIKMDDSESTSTRYASYLPFWA